MLTLKLHGGFRAWDSRGREISIKSRKAKALLAYLASPLGKPRSRETIMALLWSERGDEQARGSLRQALSGLRRDLGEGAAKAVITTHDDVALDPKFVTLENPLPDQGFLEGLHISDPAFDDWLRDERLRLEDKGQIETEQEALPLPHKPSIAVMPFLNMSGDSEQDYFADGITEDIITELSHHRSLFVIARNSSFAFKGQTVVAPEIGRQLGIRYLIEGSVRKAGDRVRVTAQLLDSEDGLHLWAERYDRKLEDIFTVQDEIVQAISRMVLGRIETYRRGRLKVLSEHQFQAYDFFLRGKDLLFNIEVVSIREARAWLEKSIEMDRANAEAFALIAVSYFMEWMAYLVADRDLAINEATKAAQIAIELDAASSRANWAMGEICILKRQFDKARFHLEKAIELNPNDPEARGVYAWFLTIVSDYNQSLEEFDRAMRIDPFDLQWLPWLRGITYFSLRNYERAIEDLKRSDTDLPEVLGWLAASYAMHGQQEEAQHALELFYDQNEKVMPVFPGRALSGWKSYWEAAMPYRDKKEHEHLFAALRKAGAPA
jgi:adenylate cyclase